MPMMNSRREFATHHSSMGHILTMLLFWQSPNANPSKHSPAIESWQERPASRVELLAGRHAPQSISFDAMSYVRIDMTADSPLPPSLSHTRRCSNLVAGHVVPLLRLIAVPPRALFPVFPAMFSHTAHLPKHASRISLLLSLEPHAPPSSIHDLLAPHHRGVVVA